MGSRRRPLSRSYSGNGRYSLYSPSSAPGPGGESEEGEGPGWSTRPDSRSYLLSIRPENSLSGNRLSPSSFRRSTFCTIIAQLTEETQPQFETTLKSRAVSEDSDAKFTCIVTGYPQPEVTWYKDDEEMDRYCGLPKYEIFRHGNRHTLQLYKCREDDAAIYQASARNTKGIVSCSGVLEVGTMTEYKIHQRWFAKLKQKAEAKLHEIEQSRKQGKENMEVEKLRTSPERFQRKRRLTGDLNLRSGVSLWEKEDVAKVHVADPKSRLREDVAEPKEPSLNATAGFSNNFLTRPLDAEVTTNGDSSMESGEENGNSFFTYIYETVEEITTKPTTRESFAKKKKKKGEEPAALLAAKQEVSSQENGLIESQNLSQSQRNAPSVALPGSMQSVAAISQLVGDVPEVKELGTPSSQDAETGKPQPCSLPSRGDTYFSLTEMYLESGAKHVMEEKMPQAPEEAKNGAQLQSPAVNINRQRETPPPASEVFLVGAVAGKEQKGQPVEQELEGNEAIGTKLTKKESELPGNLNQKRVEPPSRTLELSSEMRHSLLMGNASGTPCISSCKNVQETDLLDSVQPNTKQPFQHTTPSLNQVAPCLDVSQLRQEAGGSLLQGSLEEQMVFKVPCEAREAVKQVLSSTSNLKHSALEPTEDTNPQASQLKELIRGKPICMERETEQSEQPASPRPRGTGMLKINQESSQRPPAGSPGLTQPSWVEHPPWKEEGAGHSLNFPGKETQQRPTPSEENEELATAGSALKKASSMPGGKAPLKPPACWSGMGEGEKIAQPLTAETEPAGSWLGDSLSCTEVEESPVEPSHETSQQAAGVVGGMSWVPKQAAPVSTQVSKEDLCPVAIAKVSESLEAPGSASPSPVKEAPADGKQSAAQLPGDVKREMETRKTNESAPMLAATPHRERFPVSTAMERSAKLAPVSLTPESGEESEQRAVTPGKEPAAAAEKSSITSTGTSELKTEAPLAPRAEERTPDGEVSLEHKVQHRNLVSSLKNYLLLLLKMSSSEPDKSKAPIKKDTETEEEGSQPAGEEKALLEVGIAGLSPSTSRKILERVQNNQLFQSAESLHLSPRTSRRLTGMINQELVTSKEALGISPLACRTLPAREASEPERSALLSVPSIVVGNVALEGTGQADDGLSDLHLESSTKENSSDLVAALPCATPEELASGARRKIYLAKSKQLEEAEAAASESQVHLKRDSPTVSPRQSRKNPALLQAPVPTLSPPMDRHSPTLPRKMATLEVPKAYEEPSEESSRTLEGPEGTKQEGQAGESRKTNNPFKAPQLIRKIRAEQFSDASGNLKLWCQFFNILSDSKLTWYKDEFPVAEARRSSGDEGQAALAIVQASRKDCGVYQCTIENEYGTDSTDFLLSAEVLSGFVSREEIEVGEEIEMTPMVFAKGLADSGYWGDKFFGRVVSEDVEVGAGFLRKAWRARIIYGLEPVFESGRTCIIKVHNLIVFGTKNENTLIEKNYDITIQECKIQNSSREYCKIFAAEARAIPDFGAVPEIIPLYLIYRPANTVPYATIEEDLAGPFERYCMKERDGSLAVQSSSEIAQKCCTFQHWLYQWTNGNILVTDMEGVGWRITNVRIATKLKGYQGLKESCFPALLDQFAAVHQCNRYCEILGLKSLESLQQPAKPKGSKSPSLGRKAPSAQSSPQLQKKGLASPQGTRKGAVSPKASRKSTEAGEAQPAPKHKALESDRPSQLQ
uniref:Alpha-protein kinase 3 n=1 Tax=Chrysemys picta bellii TaxID=8478 RepID=A0A8C3FFK0_CHRPI|nr:alpha-protein kinase 3 isoform X1 [Chrysemys picta bellii]